MNKRIEIKVKGRVQGVFFRVRTKDKAESLGLIGFVKNMPDDSVLIVAEGKREKLDELIDFASEGPDHAKVSGVKVKFREPSGEFEGFEIRRE